MKTKLRLVGVLAVVAAVGTACAASGATSGAGGLIPPPAISIPYGGKVVTEINLSDSDVLGIVKQIIPAIGEVIGGLAPMATKGPIGAAEMSAIKGLDFKGFADAISGITNVRVMVVKYASNIEKPNLLKQLDLGVAKLGTFSKVVSDVGITPGASALYAQADNGGYVGYSYDARTKTLYAGRVVGSADFAKLTKWVTDTIKLGVGSLRKVAPREEPPVPETSVIEAPAPQPEKP